MLDYNADFGRLAAIVGLNPQGNPVTSNAEANLDHHPVADSSDISNAIPVIDAGGLAHGAEGMDTQAAVQAIADACREWGFFQIVNHSIPDELIDEVWRQTRRFFAAPADYKLALLRTRENPWGYYNNELTKNQRDKKEVFDFTTDGIDPIYAAENRWPDADHEFRDTMRNYIGACTDLSLTLLQAFCVGLDLPADYMHKHFVSCHTGFLRLNHYPVVDPLATSASAPDLPIADMGVHYHTDAGALTVLLQDDVGGLQVYKDGFWHDVRPIPGAFVINTGDMMQVWSNDIYKAAIHRGLPMDTKDRYSMPFFFNPAAGTNVSPLPTVTSATRPSRYSPINWSEYRGKRTDGDYADYGPEVQIAQYKIEASTND